MCLEFVSLHILGITIGLTTPSKPPSSSNTIELLGIHIVVVVRF